MHLYRERVLYMYMKEHDAFISSYVADSQELTEDEKVLSFTHYGFKNTMLLTPWCQKLEHYHFKSNLEFEANEIKITVVLFLALKPANSKEAWNCTKTSCFTFCIPYINASCYVKQFS